MERKTIDPAVEAILEREQGASTFFSRAEQLKPCPIGSEGLCCRTCSIGPCRLTGKDKEEKTGVCGATASTIAARQFARMIAAGASAHSDHGRDIAMSMLASARGEAPYEVRDEEKLRTVAAYLGITTEGKEKNKLAEEVALKALEAFGQQFGTLPYVTRAPKKRQEIWAREGVTPRGVDRDIVEVLHRTHAGTDQDAKSLLDAALRAALGSGWGGSMLATDLSDALFGTPKAIRSRANMGVLDESAVNIVMHGHEPTLSEMIIVAARDPEMVEYAKSKGATGINLAGVCCTANESLMRNGVPPAGNVMSQEVTILTGAVDAKVVDVQCVFESLVKVAKEKHTLVITTSDKGHMTGATHMPFDEHNALESAKAIVRAGIDNYANRGEVFIPQFSEPLVAGFSHEYIRYMLGGRFRASFRPLNDNIMNGRIRGIAAIVGCNTPRATQDEGIVNITKALIQNDVLVVVTGCAAISAGKLGLLAPEVAANAGAGLAEVCEAVGIPPILHLGSCVDNSRILTVLSEIVEEGGLGEDISEVPAVAISPEWYCEKALEIACYSVASGAYVLFGGTQSPVAGSTSVVKMMIDDWEERFGGKLEFEMDNQAIVEKALDHIDKKRKALGIDVQKERVLFDMEMRRAHQGV